MDEEIEIDEFDELWDWQTCPKRQWLLLKYTGIGGGFSIFDNFVIFRQLL